MKKKSLLIAALIITTITHANNVDKKTLTITLEDIISGETLKAIETMIKAGANTDKALEQALKNTNQTVKELLLSADHNKINKAENDLKILQLFYNNGATNTDPNLKRDLTLLLNKAHYDKRIVGESGIQGKYKDVLEKIGIESNGTSKK